MHEHGKRLFPRTIVIIEAPGKQRAIQTALGPDVAVIATGGTLLHSSLTDTGLIWSEPPQAWLDTLAPHAGHIDGLVIATDDDLGGELIGWQAASTAAPVLFGGHPPPKSIRRMRFSDVTPPTIKTAFHAAGDLFDEAMLAAAMVREFANHADQIRQDEARLPTHARASAQIRDAVSWLSERSNGAEQAEYQAIALDLIDEAGNAYTGFVPENRSTTARPAEYAAEQAGVIRKFFEGQTSLTLLRTTTVIQNPGLYPPSTTGRILGVAADELGLLPQTTQDHLNALYYDGASPKDDADA